ncbi:MAG: hypothetical protein AB7N76_35430 [Planctomycetota bacterium]
MTTLNAPALLETLRKLSEAGIHYTLSAHRIDAVSILIAVPGERWEVDFLADGSIDVEVFRSDGAIHGRELLADLFARHSG